jgi:hypothetical protein
MFGDLVWAQSPRKPLDSENPPPPPDTDELTCASPYESMGGRSPIFKSPWGAAQASKKGQANVIIKIPSDAKVTKMDCYRTELWFDKYPKWRCPLGRECFGPGTFTQAYRRTTSNPAEDEIVIAFVNRSGGVQQKVQVQLYIEKMSGPSPLRAQQE